MSLFDQWFDGAPITPKPGDVSTWLEGGPLFPTPAIAPAGGIFAYVASGGVEVLGHAPSALIIPGRGGAGYFITPAPINWDEEIEELILAGVI